MPIIFYALSKQACVAHQTNAPVIAIKAFERGFYPIYTRATPDDLNNGKFSNEEIESAILGSMSGWNCPGAKLAVKAIERIEEAEARGVSATVSKAELVDAQQMATEYPDTFEAPTETMLAQIKVGDAVKICANNKERFWVEVTAIDGKTLTGRIDNDLVFTDTHGLKYNDTVTFERRHIYQL